MTSIIMAIAIAVTFTVTLEPGATFDNGVCWEADGTEGIAMADGQCMTPADYDIIFGYDALAAREVGQEWNGTVFEGQTVAQVAGLTPEPAASLRPLGEGLVETPRTFTQIVRAAHLPVPA